MDNSSLLANKMYPMHETERLEHRIVRKAKSLILNQPKINQVTLDRLGMGIKETNSRGCTSSYYVLKQVIRT